MKTPLILDRFTFFDVGRKVCTMRRYDSLWCFFYTLAYAKIFDGC